MFYTILNLKCFFLDCNCFAQTCFIGTFVTIVFIVIVLSLVVVGTISMSCNSSAAHRQESGLSLLMSNSIDLTAVLS